MIQITADLIVHARGEKPPPYDNLIAIEAKKASRPNAEKLNDKTRLRAMTRVPFDGVWPWNGSHPEHVCGYAVGVYLEIDSINRKLILQFFKKGMITKEKEIRF